MDSSDGNSASSSGGGGGSSSCCEEVEVARDATGGDDICAEEAPTEAIAEGREAAAEAECEPPTDTATCAEAIEPIANQIGEERCEAIKSMNGVLKLYNAINGGRYEENEMAATMSSILANYEAAVSRVNELRMRHPHCMDRPLKRDPELFMRAIMEADSLSMQEERDGPTDDLLDTVDETNILVYKYSDASNGGIRQMGVAMCRLQSSDLRNLPLETVNFWYTRGKSYPYDEAHRAREESKYRSIVQLLDIGSQYMGWGAAMAGTGVVYAVALFDGVGASNAKSMEPPIDAVYSDSYTQLDLELWSPKIETEDQWD